VWDSTETDADAAVRIRTVYILQLHDLSWPGCGGTVACIRKSTAWVFFSRLLLSYRRHVHSQEIRSAFFKPIRISNLLLDFVDID